MSVFGYEAKKILIKQYSLVIMLFVIIASLFSLPDSTDQDYGFSVKSDKERYLEMMQSLSGRLTEEKETEIVGLYESLLEAKAAVKDVSDKLAAGSMTDEEFNNALAPYKEILNDADVIETLFERYQYTAADRDRRMLIPAKSIPVMENDGINYLFLLAVLFCSAFAIMIEHTSKGHILLRTTPDGQRKTMMAKLLMMTLMIITVSVILSCIDLIKLAAQLPDQYRNFSLCSLEKYGNTEYDMSIFSAFVWVQLMKVLGYLLISSLSMLTAHFAKNYAAAIFPYAALPIVADYLAEQDSQAYFLPTGLMKGYGYFFGEVTFTDGFGNSTVIFHGIPVSHMYGVVCAAFLFVAASCIILIITEKNRLVKKHGFSKKALLLPVISMLLFTSCSNNSDSIYNGHSDAGWYKMEAENSRYVFEIKYISEDGTGLGTIIGSEIYYTDKETGFSEKIPISVFSEYADISSLFATEKYLYYFSDFNTIARIRLSDMTCEEVLAFNSGPERTALGLKFSYDDGLPLVSTPCVFSDGKSVYFTDRLERVYRIDMFGEAVCIIDESTSEIQVDEKYIYYIDGDHILKAYELATGTVFILSDKSIVSNTLSGDGRNLYYETSEGKLVTDKEGIGKKEE